MNEKVIVPKSRSIKRIFNLDIASPQRLLNVKSKDSIALTYVLASRGDDCLKYPLSENKGVGFTIEQTNDAVGVRIPVSGTVILNLRTTFEYWEERQNV
jgi:hypothetical protein